MLVAAEFEISGFETFPYEFSELSVEDFVLYEVHEFLMVYGVKAF